jgi:hypothetical protein
LQFGNRQLLGAWRGFDSGQGGFGRFETGGGLVLLRFGEAVIEWKKNAPCPNGRPGSQRTWAANPGTGAATAALAAGLPPNAGSGWTVP